ncbi:hypothetical protein V1478_008425 [Vespula squamosa]|uniref:Uncharacterized protein n=1 Tax=Vespula squamosa TaxID=30214 RepID=A0ABD2ATG5_VESSQ
MNNSGRPIRTPINLGPRVTHCRGLRLRVELFCMVIFPTSLKIRFSISKNGNSGRTWMVYVEGISNLDRTFELIHSPSAVVVHSCDRQSKSVFDRSIQLSRLLEICNFIKQFLIEMEAIEEKTKPEEDPAPIPITLTIRLTKLDISNRSCNVYPGSFFRPGRRIPLKEVLEKRTCSRCMPFHRRD